MATGGNFPQMSTAVLNCPICLEKYRTPRSLPCLHSFCEKCLSLYIKSHVQNESNSFFCPVCRHTCQIADSNVHNENLALAFPLNFFISVVMDSTKTQKEATCEDCKLRCDEARPAKFWCKDCGEALCDRCESYHKKKRLTSSHHTVDIDKVSKEEMLVTKLELDDSCLEHTRKPIELFCHEHNKLCCFICVATDHNACKKVTTIEKYLAENEGIVDHSVILENLELMKTSTQNARNAMQQKMETMEIEQVTTLHDLLSSINAAKDHLDFLHSEFQATVNKRNVNRKESNSTNSRLIKSIEKTIENSQKITSLCSRVSSKQSCIMQYKILTQLSSQFHQLNAETKRNSVMEYAINEKVKNLSSDITCVGKVNETELPSGCEEHMASIRACLQTLEHIPFDVMKANVRFVRRVTLQDLGLGNCDFMDATYTSNGTILLADYAGGRLVFLDENFRLLETTFAIAKKAWGARVNTNGEVYVTFNNRSVQAYNLKDGKLSKALRTEEECMSVEFCKSLVITGEADHVVLRDKQWQTVKKIHTSYTGYQYLAVSFTGHTFYHKDNNAIVCRTEDGSEVFRFEHECLTDTLRLCCDRNDNVYIVDRENTNIYQISHDGSVGRVLLATWSEIEKPRAIAFHPTKDMFIVTADAQTQSDKAQIAVYEFTT